MPTLTMVVVRRSVAMVEVETVVVMVAEVMEVERAKRVEAERGHHRPATLTSVL